MHAAEELEHARGVLADLMKHLDNVQLLVIAAISTFQYLEKHRSEKDFEFSLQMLLEAIN